MQPFERPKAVLGNQPTIPCFYKAVIETKDVGFRQALSRFEY